MNARLLLALSFALNAGLLTLLLLQTASRPTRQPTELQSPDKDSHLTKTANEAATEQPDSSAPDYRRLFSALRATGLPRTEIDQILRGAALSDWQDDLRSLRGEFPSDRMDTEILRELIELRRAREAALSEVIGKEEFLASRGWIVGDAWDEIPSGKQKAVVMLEEDYQLLLGEAEGDSDTIDLLQKERMQDLASILTDSEFAAYASIASFGSPPTISNTESGETNSLDARQSDPDFQKLQQLAERFDLSPDRAAEVYELSRVVQVQQEEIESDSDLSPEEREKAKRYLIDDAREVVRLILGEEAFDAYRANSGEWLR